MGRSKRSFPRGADHAEQWLRPDRAERSRPWAYQELLFGANNGAESDELSALAADVAVDLAELKRMQNELYDQVVRIAGLEGRLQVMMSAVGARVQDAPIQQAEQPDGRAEIRSFPSDPLRSHASPEPGRSLARCEGFRVDSPTGFVGFVEGLRFVSRIDEPDLLEVRGGLFGRELALIPIEAIAEISLAEERLVVRSAPNLYEEHGHELVNRLRKALHVMTASLR